MRHHSPHRFSVNLSDGDLRRLRVFCAVARCGEHPLYHEDLSSISIEEVAQYDYALLPDHFVQSVWRLKGIDMGRTRAAAELEAGVA
jgi:hypothetical protein